MRTKCILPASYGTSRKRFGLHGRHCLLVLGWASQVKVIYRQGRKPSAASLLGISQQDRREEERQALFVKSGDSNTFLLSVCKNTISAPHKTGC